MVKIKSVSENALEVENIKMSPEMEADLEDYVMQIKKLWFCGCRKGREALKNGAGMEIPEMRCTINVAYTIIKREAGFCVRLIHNTAYEACWVNENRQPTARMNQREIAYAMALMIQAIAEKVVELDQEHNPRLSDLEVFLAGLLNPTHAAMTAVLA